MPKSEYSAFDITINAIIQLIALMAFVYCIIEGI